MATDIIAVFDIGKTNKKILLFNQQFELVYQHEEHFPTMLDDDNFECDNINLITGWIHQTIHSLSENNEYNIQAINFSTYGATLAFVGHNGSLVTPLYNYLKPMPAGIADSVYKKFGSVDEFCRCTASPSLGMLNSGLQILWLKRTKPETFENVKYIMHFPQYLNYYFTGKVVSEYTSIGCHTAMWNFDSMSYHPWLASENIYLPQPISNDTLFNTNINGHLIQIGTGIHDSSASLVPYLMFSEAPFILISTGTWCIFMNPFNNEPLTTDQLHNDTLCYLSTQKQQVKSSRLFLGHRHDDCVHHLAQHFKVSSSYYKNIKANEQLVYKMIKQKAVFISQDIESVDLSVFSSFEEAYHRLIIDLTSQAINSLNLIIPANDKTKVVYISGGFAHNELFTRIMASFLNGKDVYTSEVDNATALGAAMVLKPALKKLHAARVHLGLKRVEPFPNLKLAEQK